MLRKSIIIPSLILVVGLAPSLALASGRDLTLVPKNSPVSGERRLALVIGNAAYTGDGVHPLKNPVNDANAMASTLQKVGFKVREVCDADRDEIRDAVHDFVDDIRESPADSVALLYYSGHGMQVAGENYLIPIGFTMPAHVDDVPDNAYDMRKALDEMQAANARVNIVILDACRNNPYATDRSVGGKGLGKMEASGVYIAYATAEGQTADDNPSSSNGLYTASLLKALRTPGLDIHQVFQKARRIVWNASGHTQYPYDYDGLLSDNFYFAGKSVSTHGSDTDDATDSMAADSFDRGRRLFNEHKDEEAELFYRQAVQLEPENPEYQEALGADLYDEEKYDDALPYLRKAGSLSPDNAAYQAAIGDDLHFDGNYAAAEPYYRRAVRLDPSNPDRQEQCGRDLAMQRKYVEAEPFYREAIRLSPSDASLQDELGNDLYNQKRYSEAEPLYVNAIRLGGDLPNYEEDLKNCREHLGDAN